MSSTSSLPDTIRTLRRAAGLSQEQLADQLGVSRQAVTKWETGIGTPDLENVVAVARLFGVTVDALLGAAGLADEHDAADPGVSRSVTQCDVVDGVRDFDIAYGHARTVTLRSAVVGKIRVELASASIVDVAGAFKVGLDTEGRSYDIEVRRVAETTATAARRSLDVLVEIPAGIDAHVELSGSADEVRLADLQAGHVEVGGRFARLALDQVAGRVEVDTSADLGIVCHSLPDRLEVNQIGATSWIELAGTEEEAPAFSTRCRGLGNKVLLEDLVETPGAEHVIELAGMKSELTIRPTQR